MAKRQALNVTQNNVNMVERPTQTPPSVKNEAKVEKHRTSLVFKKSNYEYLQKMQRKWSFERDQKMSVEDVLSEIIEAHEKANQ
jgi:hypothetical protein